MKHSLFTTALLFIMLFTLTSCDSLTPDPTQHPTVTVAPADLTPEPKVNFTMRLAVGTVDPAEIKAVVYVGSFAFNFSEQAQGGKSPMKLVEPICYQETETGECKTEDVSMIMASYALLVVESGHWCATQQGQDYSLPQPCTP